MTDPDARIGTGILAGRHAIVTGGSRGIGLAIAHALASQGAAVTLMSRDAARLERAAAELRDAERRAPELRGEQFGGDVGWESCDVTDTDSVAAAFRSATRARGDAFILVNNAGQSEGSAFLDTGRDLWERMLAANLTSAYLCTQQVLPAMLAARSGRIVNIASTSGLKGYRNITAYCAAKHGLVGLTRALAAETVRAGITVNAVCPAYTETDMAGHAVHNIMRDLDRSEADARAMIERTIPRGTLITPAEVAGTVAWLCSPLTTAVTGQAIAVAGGEI